MKKKLDIKNILIMLLILSQIFLFYKYNNLDRFETIKVENIEIRDSKNIKSCEITNGGQIFLYNKKGEVIVELGQIGYDNGGGIKLYDSEGKIATFIDNRIINSYSNDSTYSSSIGRDMSNNGFIALFDSTGNVYYLKDK